MKRFYVILVLAIAIALALAVGISKHTGYVLITYPHVLHYESSLWRRWWRYLPSVWRST